MFTKISQTANKNTLKTYKMFESLPSQSLTARPLKSYPNPIGKDRLPFPPFFMGYVKLRGCNHLEIGPVLEGHWGQASPLVLEQPSPWHNAVVSKRQIFVGKFPWLPKTSQKGIAMCCQCIFFCAAFCFKATAPKHGESQFVKLFWLGFPSSKFQ